jgi:hypothetical protein
MLFEAKRLRVIVQRVYESRKNEISVSASSLAAEAMAELDPNYTVHEDIRFAADLQFRQVARSILRGLTKNEDEDGDQIRFDLHDALQTRYPTAHTVDNPDPTYILLEYMSDEDILFNIRRLDNEADAKTRHARALDAYLTLRRSRVA